MYCELPSTASESRYITNLGVVSSVINLEATTKWSQEDYKSVLQKIFSFILAILGIF